MHYLKSYGINEQKKYFCSFSIIYKLKLGKKTPSIEDCDSTRITLQKNSYFAQFLSAHLNYIPKICVILAAITMNFFRFFKDGFFSKNQFVEKNIFFVIKFGVKIFPKNTSTSAI